MRKRLACSSWSPSLCSTTATSLDVRCSEASTLRCYAIAESYTYRKTNRALRKGLKLATCGVNGQSNLWPNICWIVPGRTGLKLPLLGAIAKVITQLRRSGYGSLKVGRAFAASAVSCMLAVYARKIMRASKCRQVAMIALGCDQSPHLAQLSVCYFGDAKRVEPPVDIGDCSHLQSPRHVRSGCREYSCIGGYGISV